MRDKIKNKKTEQECETGNESEKLPVVSNSLEGSEVLSLLGFLSGGWSLLRMLLVLKKEEDLCQTGNAFHWMAQNQNGSSMFVHTHFLLLKSLQCIHLAVTLPCMSTSFRHANI